MHGIWQMINKKSNGSRTFYKFFLELAKYTFFKAAAWVLSLWTFCASSVYSVVGIISTIRFLPVGLIQWLCHQLLYIMHIVFKGFLVLVGFSGVRAYNITIEAKYIITHLIDCSWFIVCLPSLPRPVHFFRDLHCYSKF